MEHAVLRKFTGPQEHSFWKEVYCANENYHACTAGNYGHGLGSPGPHRVCAAIRFIANTDCLPPPLQAQAKDLAIRVGEISIKDDEDLGTEEEKMKTAKSKLKAVRKWVKVFHVVDQKDGNSNVTLQINDAAAETLLIHAFEHWGFEEEDQVAPPIGLETAIQSRLNGKGKGKS